jgi:hypothetical protein
MNTTQDTNSAKALYTVIKKYSRMILFYDLWMGHRDSVGSSQSGKFLLPAADCRLLTGYPHRAYEY